MTVACHDLKNIDNTTHFHIYNAGGVFSEFQAILGPFSSAQMNLALGQKGRDLCGISVMQGAP